MCMNNATEITMTTQTPVILPETVCAWLREGKQVALEIKGEQLIAREIPHQAAAPSAVSTDNKFDAQKFAERTAGKTFDELLHEGKRDAQKLLDDQGIASMALYLSELMAQSIEAQRFVRVS